MNKIQLLILKMNNYVTPLLEVHDLVVSYRNKPVLWNIDFILPEKKLIAILGPNGAGKSTLLRAIIGQVNLDRGWVKINGNKPKQEKKSISYMPQRETIDWDFPISVREVVTMGRYIHMGFWKRPSSIDREKIEDALKQVGLLPFAERQISELSGGQQQRVFLARAIAQEAQLYLMDEPFSSIDNSTEQLMLKLLKKMVTEGKTIIVIHHDPYLVKNFFDFVMLLNVRLVNIGSPKKLITPKKLQETYGMYPSILQKAGELLKNDGREHI